MNQKTENVKTHRRASTLSIALGWLKAHPSHYIFPIKPGCKRPPLLGDNLDLASNAPAKIRAWNLTQPGCNWGIACKKSRLIVVDVDEKAGKHGADTLDKIQFEHGQLPDTLRVRTPSGGHHIYFNEANDVRHRMKVCGFGPDVDSTNYVLLPGCALDEYDGGKYTVEHDAPIADSPAWFGEYLKPTNAPDATQLPAVDLDKRENVERAIDYLKNDSPRSIIGKNGEHTTLMVAAKLKDMGVSQDKAVELMAKHYNVEAKCDPLWHFFDGPVEDRMDVKIKNAWRYLKQTQPGADTAEADFAEPPCLDGLDAMIEWWKEFDARPRPKSIGTATDGLVETGKHTRSEEPLSIARAVS